MNKGAPLCCGNPQLLLPMVLRRSSGIRAPPAASGCIADET
jgi:hypothetical protein